MVGDDAVVAAEKILLEILRLARQLARNASQRYDKSHPKIKVGEHDLNKLIKSGEDMVAIPEALKDDEIEMFRDLADDMGILYSVVDFEGENMLLVRKSDLDRAELCLNKIFKKQALESVKEKVLEDENVTEQDWEQAVALFDAEEIHALNEKGVTFEDALDHITDRDYSRDNTYYLFDRNCPDLHIEMKSEKAIDHNNKEYTKTTYSVYYKDELVGRVDDSRFPGREKNHWHDLKEQMKHTFGREDVPNFSDNVFLLYSENDLNKFRDTYNKQLACIAENQNKRLGRTEVEGLKQALNDFVIPLLQDQDPELKDKIEETLNKIIEKQDRINELKLEAFEYVGEKGSSESKEEFRERMEKLNSIQDAVKEQERELAELYNAKDQQLSQAEAVIGKNLENEAYANAISKVNAQGRSTTQVFYASEKNVYKADKIVVPMKYALRLNVMLSLEGKGIEEYETREDGTVVLKTDSYRDRQRFNMLNEKLEKVIENDTLKNLQNVFNRELSADESKAIINAYAERVCEKLEVGSVENVLEQISSRECFNGKTVNLVDKTNIENFVSIKIINNPQTNQLDNIYSVSIEGNVMEYSSMEEVLEAVDGKIEEFDIELNENEEIIEKSDHSGRDDFSDTEHKFEHESPILTEFER